MKTLKKGNKIIRVKEAQLIVLDKYNKKGKSCDYWKILNDVQKYLDQEYEYCSKSEWKNNVRDKKKNEEDKKSKIEEAKKKLNAKKNKN